MNKKRQCIWLFAGLLAGSLFGSENDYPVWEDVSGRELEARIIQRTDEIVVMKRVDGREYRIPINRFSEESRTRILDWSPPPIEVPVPDDAVLVIETPEGVGSGFLVQDGGRVWVYTNRHVIGDSLDLTVTDVSGEEIELGAMEVVRDRDIARFATRLRKGLELAGTPATGQEVAVYGNSQGAGVITRSEGEVLGLSPDSIEVSSEIVSGNSGGPVLDAENRVLGISTFVTSGWSGDPTTVGTRYTEPRRFALRLDEGVEFVPIRRKAYAEEVERFAEQAARFEDALELFQTILYTPSEKVLVSEFSSEEVADVAVGHNRDVAKLQGYYYSRSELNNAIRKMKSRLMDSLEDTLEVGRDAMKRMERMADDDRQPSLMSYDLTRKREALVSWEATFEKAGEYFD